MESTPQAKKAPALFWEVVRAESGAYFPTLEVIRLSLQDSSEIIRWSKQADPMYRFRLSYEEPMLGQEELAAEPHVFWFRGTRCAGDAVLPVDMQLVYDAEKELWLAVGLQFGKHGSVDYAADLIKRLKEEAGSLGVNFNNLRVAVSGFRERAKRDYIHETNLVTFVPGKRGRLVHKTEQDLIDRAQFPALP